MTHSPVVRALIRRMFNAHVLAFRDVANGEEPFHYSSGHRGPGYVMVKGLVSQDDLLKALVYQLAVKVLDVFPDVEYVAGNATGGMVPGWILHEALSTLTGRKIPYIYIRGSRKLGGHGEQITGDQNNPEFFSQERLGIVCEELVNFAQTTTNSALVQRAAGYDVRYGATILDYDHARSNILLRETGVKLFSLMTLGQFLDYADEFGFERRLIDNFRSFLADPLQWQATRGFTPTPRE